MNSIRRFLRERGFYFALLGCILMATLASFWAVRTMISRMSREDSRMIRPEEGTEWQMPAEIPQPVQAAREDVPITAAPPASSAPSSGASGVREPSALQSEQEPAAEESAGSVSLYGWPVNGEVTHPFSGNELVYNPTLKDWRTHNGVDMGSDAGSRVEACTAGEVTSAEETGLWGTVVEVTDEQNRLWRYCGLERAAVAVGDRVNMGTAIGTVGTVECEQGDGSHLHLELLQDGEYLNPQQIIG